MKKISIISLAVVSICAFSIFNFQFSISAQESTSSADTTEEIKQSVKERLEKVSKEGESKVLGDSTKKAYVGTLESLTQNTLTLNTAFGTKRAAVAETAKVIGKNRESLKTDELEIGSQLIIMGYATNSEVLDARRVVVSDTPIASTYQPYHAKITSIAKSVITTEVGDIKLASKAKVTQTYEDNQAEIETSDLKVGDIIIFLGKPDPKKSTLIETVAVHLPLGRAIITQPEEDSTPSAKKASPSPKASPKG